MPHDILRSVLPALHEAALNPQRWQALCDRLHEATGGVRTHLIFFDAANPGAVPLLTSGYDPDQIRQFREYYGEINPWRNGFVRFTPMRAVSSEEMLPHAELARTEFYSDWLLPQENISAGAGIVLERDPRRLLVAGGHVRMRDQDHLEARWKQLLDLLGPSLRHAVEVNRVLSDLHLRNGLLEEGFAPRDASVLVLSDNRGILFANEMAEQALRSGRVLRSDLRQRLWFSDQRAQEQFEAALRRPGKDMAPLPLHIRDSISKTRHTAHLLRLGAEVLPFAGLDPISGTIPESVAVLVLGGPSREEGLRRQYGLTPSEAGIAIALFDGLSLSEIALMRGTSIHTVRDQSKAVLGKFNVRRQAEMVALIARQAGGRHRT